MSEVEEFLGRQIGLLTVVAEVGRHKHGYRLWLCRCSCGKEVIKTIPQLKNYKPHCGSCLPRNPIKKSAKQFKHGHYGTPTYRSWSSMLTRCRNKKHADYPRYGGRGVLVCKQWEVFANFLADMGERPDGASIDRIDNNGNYEPGNCRWATRKQQANNTRQNRKLEINGQAKHLSEAAQEHGIAISTLALRLRRGWSLEDALSKPVTRGSRHHKSA